MSSSILFKKIRTLGFWIGCLMIIGMSHSFAQNINVPNKKGPMGMEVNTRTGNLFMARNDLYIPARKLTLEASFFYNSVYFGTDKGYGNGWSFSYLIQYRVDSTGDIIITWPEGRRDRYKKSGTQYTAPVGIYDHLSEYQPGKLLVETKHGIQYYFDQSTHQRVTRIQEPNGNFISMTYTDSLVTNVVNSAGQSIALTYNNGKLSSLVDALVSPMRTYTFAYDGYGNLVTVTDPQSKTIKYTYLINGPLASVTDKNNNVADIIYYSDFMVSEVITCNTRQSYSYDSVSRKTVVIDYVPTATNQTTTYTYNDKGGLADIKGNCCGYNMAFTYDAEGNVLTKTNGGGSVFSYTYDNRGNILTATDPYNNKETYTYSAAYNKITSYTDRNGNTTVLAKDSKGNTTSITHPGNAQFSATYASNGDMQTITDARGNTFTLTHNPYGQISQFAGSLGFTASYAVNARGNTTSITDAKGSVYTMQYDNMDRLTNITNPLGKSILFTYDAVGNVTSITDEKGHVQTMIYDASNRVVAVKDALGKQTKFAYDAMNNVIKVTTRNNAVSLFTYDNLNRLVKMIDGVGKITSYGYDANGNRVTTTTPNGNTITDVYDKLDRLVSSSDLLGSFGSLVYDNNDNIISYTNGSGAVSNFVYNQVNRMIRSTDALGNSYAYTYDKNNNVLTVTDRKNNTVSYAYDALNRMLSATNPLTGTVAATYDVNGNTVSLKDENNRTTTYTWDLINRMKTRTYPDASFMQFDYDEVGNMITKRLTDGTSITYQYDVLDRLTSKTLPGNHVFAYGYDDGGRITSATNNQGTIGVGYDALDRIVSESFNGHTTLTSYDDVARKHTITYPDGSAIDRLFDVRDRLTGIVSGNKILASYQYNGADQIQQLVNGNGVKTNWQYDFSNRLNNQISSPSTIQQLFFQYDNEGNKTQVTRPVIPNGSELYGYDNNDRLVSFKQGNLAGGSMPSPAIQNTYAYDPQGNRTGATLNGQANSYGTNTLNQYTSLVNPSGTTNFTYDGNGNLTFDGTYYRRYDAEGRKLVDSINTTQVIRYAYDALGRRVRKTEGGSDVNYYYSVLLQLEQRNAADSILEKTVYENAIVPVSKYINNQTYFYHQNDLNSVEAITDSSGKLIERYLYDAFGKPQLFDSFNNVIPSSTIKNQYFFTGQRYEANTGSYAFHFRNYSVVTGRFDQRDPLGYTEGMGLYQYVGNNPVNRIDPLGLKWGDDKTSDGLGVAGSANTASDLEAMRRMAEAEERMVEKTVDRLGKVKDTYQSGNASARQLAKEIAPELKVIKNTSKFRFVLGKLSPWLNGADLAYKIYKLKHPPIDPCTGKEIPRSDLDQLKLEKDVALATLAMRYPVVGVYNLLDYGVELGVGTSMTDMALNTGDAINTKIQNNKFLRDYEPLTNTAKGLGEWAGQGEPLPAIDMRQKGMDIRKNINTYNNLDAQMRASRGY